MQKDSSDPQTAHKGQYSVRLPFWEKWFDSHPPDWVVQDLIDEKGNKMRFSMKGYNAWFFDFEYPFPKPAINWEQRGGTVHYLALEKRPINDKGNWGGRKIKIRRWPTVEGGVRAETNYFRISGNCTNAHLTMLAERAGDRFEWMETITGRKAPASEWLTHQVALLG